MRDDIGNLVDRIESMPDSQLVEMLKDDPEKYTPGALSIAEAEAEARGGLDKLISTRTQDVATKKGERFRGTKQRVDRFFSSVLSREPSEKYSGLSYVSLAMRVISFVLGGLALGASIFALVALLDVGVFGWVAASMGALQAGVGALLFYGGSELINVVIEIEKNTRDARTQERSDDERPMVQE